MPIWGDVELAWRLDQAGWFGTAEALAGGDRHQRQDDHDVDAARDAGRRRAAGVLCGNIGNPVIDMLAEPAELLAVELSSFQLHWAPSLRPEAGAVLNVAEDHLDWHGSMDAYAADKARALDGRVAVVGLDDPVAAGLLDGAAAPVRVGFTLGEPAAGELGVRDGALIDRAFADGLVLRRHGVDPGARAGRCARRVGRRGAGPRRRRARRRDRRCAVVVSASARTGPRWSPRSTASTYVDDSKATNPHAAHASIAAYPRVVWIAGGLLKGASVDELVSEVSNRLVGAVLIGRDRAWSPTRYRDTPRMSPSWRL